MHGQVHSECQQRMWKEVHGSTTSPHARWCLGYKAHLASASSSPIPSLSLPHAPGPPGDICCPPGPAPLVHGLLTHRWVTLVLSLPCHSICCEGTGSPAALPQQVTKSQGSKPSCHFLLVKEDPALPSRGGTNTMMSTLLGLQRGSGFPQRGQWRAFLHLRWVKCPPRLEPRDWHLLLSANSLLRH